MKLNKIEEIIDTADNFSGVIQIVEKGKVTLNLARGYAKREDLILNNTETAFGIASGTKGFTALGILRLIDQGKLKLEDRVFEILPYDFPNMDHAVSVRHLLTNTSGIYDYFDEEVMEDFGQIFEKVPVHKIWGPKDMLPLLIEGKEHFKPGERFKYCNSGFVILGLLIEVVSGRDYHDFIENEVVKPLGLTKTGCYKSNQLPQNCAYGYLQDSNGEWYSNIYEIPIACTADGGLYTTADDISRMWKGLFSGNLISYDLLKETFSIQAKVGEETGYGFGFWLQHDKEGNVYRNHLVGGDPGVSFHSVYSVDEDFIITILGNTSDDVDPLLDEIIKSAEV